jgi:T5SS/PEP-CTERM-associated repeat protein
MSRESTIIHHHGTGDAVAASSLILVVCLCLFYFAQPVRADITWSGDIDPADPTTWDASTLGFIGKTGTGTLNITDGSDVLDNYGYIGYESGSTGEVTVVGTGSTWTNNGLYISNSGSGMLNIMDGGAVTIKWNTWVSHHADSSGTIHFDNGTLTTGDFLCGSDDLTGTGTINTHGLVSDVDLVFDATHGLNQTFNINDNPGQNITVNLTVDYPVYMGAGFSGVGTMSISDGRVIESTRGYIGYKSGSMGEVWVDGPGSTLTYNDGLDVGHRGSGTLVIENGGVVNSGDCYIGNISGSTGEVTVVGTGSTWMNNGLYVGVEGSGTLDITGGGAVSSVHGYIGIASGSMGEVTVAGTGSTWMNIFDLFVGNDGSGTLDITSGGEVTVGGDTIVSCSPGSSSTIHFDNGTFTTGGFLCDLDDITGTGTINTHGLVSDVDLVFDATHGLNQTFNINDNPGQNITVNLTVDGSSTYMGAGHSGIGTLSISDGIVIESTRGYVGYNSGSTGEVTVDGNGSMWSNNRRLYIGISGNGTLNIVNGGEVSSEDGYIGNSSDSTSEVTVDGPGSTWMNSDDLHVGRSGHGMLNITGGGLVSVAGTLTIDNDLDGDSFINMATDGMLALHGDADDSLTDFLGLINGTDAIRYWDDSVTDWADITGATYGRDYTLSYLTAGDLAGYTLLTVPEPAALSLLILGGVTMLRRRRSTLGFN